MKCKTEIKETADGYEIILIREDGVKIGKYFSLEYIMGMVFSNSYDKEKWIKGDK